MNTNELQYDAEMKKIFSPTISDTYRQANENYQKGFYKFVDKIKR